MYELNFEFLQKQYVTMMIAPYNCFHKALNHLLKGLLSKEVQLEYSGCGRKLKGFQKKNFSSTNAYEISKSR